MNKYIQKLFSILKYIYTRREFCGVKQDENLWDLHNRVRAGMPHLSCTHHNTKKRKRKDLEMGGIGMIEVLAIDIGASSGRGVSVKLADGRFTLEEIGRFANVPKERDGEYFWDFDLILASCGALLQRCGACASVGIDTWGVDFGLLDEKDQHVGDFLHYRSKANAEKQKRVMGIFSPEELYLKTGTQNQAFNTIFQLYGMPLSQGERMLLMPDYLNFCLTGKRATEYTIASTTGLMDIQAADWCWDVIDKLGYPRSLFGKIHKPGKRLGCVRGEFFDAGEGASIDVISVASHDTASAFLAGTHGDKSFALLVSGTWSLMGTELDRPIVTKSAYQKNFTNEGGAGDTIRFLKNIMGTWILQQFSRQTGMSFAEISGKAQSFSGKTARIDVDDPRFLGFDNVKDTVFALCRESGQRPPATDEELCRCIYMGLAMKYRFVLEELSSLTGRHFAGLQIVGGGVKDRFLCQLTADVCGVPVIAGPIEASVIGNAMIQMIVGGEIASIAEARAIARNSFDYMRYQPERGYEEEYQDYRAAFTALS